MNANNILVVGAHFDDAELGCGGTMARFAAEGKKVYKLTLTNNVTNFAQMDVHVDFESSLHDSANACAVTGAEEIRDFNFVECNHLVYCTEVMQQIESILMEKNIDTIFMHFHSDMNQDHIAASSLCLTAARHCRNLLYYQSNGYVLNTPFYPTVFVDISDTFETKRKALMAYGEEHNRFGGLFGVSLDRNSVWGYENGVRYAEGFMPVKVCE